MQDCRNCKSWKKCPGIYDWFAPSDIKYCPTQVHWIMEHLLMMEDGRWPLAYSTMLPAEPSNRQPSGNASFEQVKAITADVTKRLSACGTDGILAYRVLSCHWEKEDLAKLMSTDIEKIDRSIERAIRYCSGWKQRTQSYENYIKHRG